MKCKNVRKSKKIKHRLHIDSQHHSIMALSIGGLYATLNISNIQHN